MATWEGTFLNGRYRIYLVAERFCPCMRPVRYSSEAILRSKKKTFVGTFESSNEDCIRSLLPLHCPQVAAMQISAVGVRWNLQLPSRGIETTVTAGSLLNDLLTKLARALTVLRALQNHEEGRRKVKSMPTLVNLSQGGSTLHSPEATEKKASTTSACVRGKDPQPVVSGRRAKNPAEILSSYKKTKKPKKRPQAKPAAKQPPKKKAKLLPGESSESGEFEETEEDEEEEPPSGDEEEEPPSGDDDDEDETQRTQIPDGGALRWAWLPLQQEDQWGAWRGVPISKWRPWRTEITRNILQQKTKLGPAGTICWVPADYKSAVWHSVKEYCVAARSYATEEECKNAAAVASATGGVPAPSARKKKVKAKRPKKKRKTPTKSGGKPEEEDAGEGDKEDTEKKDEVAVQVSGSES